MSFLEALKIKKQKLKPTETLVTRVDGRQFLETAKNEVLGIAAAGKRYGFVVDTKPDDVPSKITECLYLGAQDSSDPTILEKYGIKNVLSIGVQPPLTSPEVAYKFVECLDLPETNIFELLTLECVPFIRAAEVRAERVLVHCNAGVSRSSAIVIGFLILMRKLDYDAAYAVVKEARSCVQPNCGFVRQLKNLSIE